MKILSCAQVDWCREHAQETPHAITRESFKGDLTHRDYFTRFDPIVGAEYKIKPEVYELMPDEFKALKGQGEYNPGAKKEKTSLAPVQIFEVPVLMAKNNKVISILVMAETLDEAKQAVISTHGKDVQRFIE